MQSEILEKNPSAKLRVYAIWLPMLLGDAAVKWRRALISDSRVTHLWNPTRTVGRWFAGETNHFWPRGVAWDVYFLYGPEARWEHTPSPLVSWGYTIVRTREKLQADFLDLLKR